MTTFRASALHDKFMPATKYVEKCNNPLTIAFVCGKLVLLEAHKQKETINGNNGRHDFHRGGIGSKAKDQSEVHPKTHQRARSKSVQSRYRIPHQGAGFGRIYRSGNQSPTAKRRKLTRGIPQNDFEPPDLWRDSGGPLTNKTFRESTLALSGLAVYQTRYRNSIPDRAAIVKRQ